MKRMAVALSAAALLLPLSLIVYKRQVQDHQHGHRRDPAPLPWVLREAAELPPRRPHLQGRLAGLRHGRPDHRPDDRREDRHRVDGRLPAAAERGPRQAARPPHPSGVGHRLQPARRTRHRGHRPGLQAHLPHGPQGQEGVHEHRLGRGRHSRTGPAARRHRPGHRHLEAQPAARRGSFGPLRRQCGRAVAVRRLAGPARLPGQGEGPVRRRPAEPPHVPRRHRPRGLHPEAPGRPGDLPQGPGAGHGLPRRPPRGRRREGRRSHRPARRGGLPLQRRPRHRDLRPGRQTQARLRAEAGRLRAEGGQADR